MMRPGCFGSLSVVLAIRRRRALGRVDRLYVRVGRSRRVERGLSVQLVYALAETVERAH